MSPTGTLVYAHYGSFEDFQRLQMAQLILKGSIALIRFGHLHPSEVVNFSSHHETLMSQIK